VNPMFLFLAAAMLIGALVLLLAPLLRGGAARDPRRAALQRAHRAGVLDANEFAAKLASLEPAAPGGARPSRALPAAIALLLPLAAILLYRTVGEPRALDSLWQEAVAATTQAEQAQAAPGEPAAGAPEMEQAVTGLAERLRQEPDDKEGWMLLGRAYKSMERFEPAREALANAYRLAPDDANVLIEYAEAMVLASSTRRFDGEARTLLEKAVQLEPDNPRGQWMLGIGAYQEQRFGDAAAIWEKLLAALPPDADARASLMERIADARERAGLPALEGAAPIAAAPRPAEPNAQPPAPATASEAPASTARLTVSVDIAPELKARVGASDVLFVFARAASGPRMPLSIQRLPASSLPVTVTLDDSTSMMPTMKLSLIPQVVVGARISKSGQAAPAPGDFETLSEPMSNSRSDIVQLVIDRVVP
jgi:cytochrome c-type biogenesis protein CcmH